MIAYREEQSHKEGVSEREPMDTLTSIRFQVDIPAGTILDLTLLEFHAVCVNDLLTAIHGLCMNM